VRDDRRNPALNNSSRIAPQLDRRRHSGRCASERLPPFTKEHRAELLALARLDLTDVMRELLKAATERQLDIAMLKSQLDMSFRQIAEVLEMNEKTVQREFHRIGKFVAQSMHLLVKGFHRSDR
jgi:DNA-directed RNA polymerase specialized sigma24 family protein